MCVCALVNALRTVCRVWLSAVWYAVSGLCWLTEGNMSHRAATLQSCIHTHTQSIFHTHSTIARNLGDYWCIWLHWNKRLLIWGAGFLEVAWGILRPPNVAPAVTCYYTHHTNSYFYTSPSIHLVKSTATTWQLIKPPTARSVWVLLLFLNWSEVWLPHANRRDVVMQRLHKSMQFWTVS